jgi:hypothetical protein
METRIWQSTAVAVNREYSSHGAVLRDGDEVALLPPVSGGCREQGAGNSCAYGEKRASLGTARTAKSSLRSQRLRARDGEALALLAKEWCERTA